MRAPMTGFLALVALVLCAALPARAAQPCPLPEDPQVIIDTVWPLLDANHDGGLSAGEIEAFAPGYGSLVLQYADTNNNGKISKTELNAVLALLGGDPLGLIDTNGDRVITFSEAADLGVTQEQFAQIDLNNDGRVDCVDLGEIAPDGETTPEGETPKGCPLPDDFQTLIHFLWAAADADHDQTLSRAEMDSIAPQLTARAFGPWDLNGDDIMTYEESLATINFFAPLLVLETVDTSGNGTLEPGETSGFASQQEFAELDRNRNGVLDCEDLAAAPEGEGELTEFCPLPDDNEQLLRLIWPLVDSNQDGGLSIQELAALGIDVPEEYFGLVDLNRDGKVSLEEALSLAPVVLQTLIVTPGAGDGLLGLVDTNGDRVISYNEVAEYIDEATFIAADLDRNGVIDCNDLQGVTPDGETDGEVVWEGEVPQEGEPAEPCPLPNDILALLDLIWPIADADQSGGISLHEVLNIYPDFPTEYFPLADQNNNGEVSMAELQALLPLLDSLLPGAADDILSYVDANANGVIEFEEVSEYASAQQFASVDLNQNGVIDCGDFDGVSPEGEQPGEGEVVVEGELPIEGEPNTYCPLPLDPFVLIHFVWPAVDVNSDQAISRDELDAVAPEVTEDAFDYLDANNDDRITFDEVLALPVILGGGEAQVLLAGPIPPDLIALVDVNQDGVLSYAEVTAYAEPVLFTRLDHNQNGVLDCGDLGGVTEPGEGELGPPEGEDEPEGEPTGPEICAVAPLLQDLFPLLDTNRDGAITLAEIRTLGPQANLLPIDDASLFRQADLNNDGRVTLDEVAAVLRRCNGDVPGEGEPGTPEAEVRVRRHTSGNGFYVPGRELVVETTILAEPNLGIAALALVETLPERWAFTRVLSDGGAAIVPEFGDSGRVTFVWTTVPRLPVTVRYTAGTFTANGPQAIVGHAAYRIGDQLNELISPITSTPLGLGWSEDHCHAADYNHDWTLSLSELLRVVQFFNLGAIGCDIGTEDGYAPSAADLLSCIPHSGDYNADWLLELQELLRMIQIYNSPNGAYYVAEDAATDDGYVPGMFELK
ncbi:MAG: hypothetical protein GC168_09545 [Candidatus Hydrogenedens sp.]|nr:hypothetical protein [Candidatus Hydrogenedens sp.]